MNVGHACRRAAGPAPILTARTPTRRLESVDGPKNIDSIGARIAGRYFENAEFLKCVPTKWKLGVVNLQNGEVLARWKLGVGI